MIPTVRIKTKPCEGNPDGIVLINEADYDPAVHQLADQPDKPKAKASAKVAEKQTEKAAEKPAGSHA